MIRLQTLLLPLPISNQPKQNMTQKINITKTSYLKAFIKINITPPYVSLTLL
jgi:hypothetical protein